MSCSNAEFVPFLTDTLLLIVFQLSSTLRSALREGGGETLPAFFSVGKQSLPPFFFERRVQLLISRAQLS